MTNIFAQEGFRCKVEWGPRGAAEGARRGDIVVVVDVLSFSTAVIAAIQQGGVIYPCTTQEEAVSVARMRGAELAVGRSDVPGPVRFSLSPLTYQKMEPGARVAIASPNGATCSRAGENAPYLLIGALVNARAVAIAVAARMSRETRDVTVAPCGERWSDTGEIRFAIEDYLGAGAILSQLLFSKSPEALVCQLAFESSRDRLAEILWECASGRELRDRGYGDDVAFASRLNSLDAVAVWRDGALEREGDVG